MDIIALAPSRARLCQEHLVRHRAESGGPEGHFMPFDPDDPQGPRGLDVDALGWPLDRPGWHRWFVAEIAADTVPRLVGHVNLKGDGLRTALHRCELGIGIERGWRAAGLGQQLMATALAFAEAAPSLAWVDLRVFAHNTRARRLYAGLGFEEIGVVRDRLRIRGETIDDVLMTRSVAV